jgi:hypothetical protein
MRTVLLALLLTSSVIDQPVTPARVVVDMLRPVDARRVNLDDPIGHAVGDSPKAWRSVTI